MPIFKVLIMWLLFLPIPIINGFLREKWYKAIVGDMLAHQIGVLVLGLVFLLYVFLFFRSTIASFPASRLLLMGIIWLFLTLAFEFGLGLATGHSWSYMLADYNILKGRIWPLVPAIIFASPFIIKALARD